MAEERNELAFQARTILLLPQKNVIWASFVRYGCHKDVFPTSVALVSRILTIWLVMMQTPALQRKSQRYVLDVIKTVVQMLSLLLLLHIRLEIIRNTCWSFHNYFPISRSCMDSSYNGMPWHFSVERCYSGI